MLTPWSHGQQPDRLAAAVLVVLSSLLGAFGLIMAYFHYVSLLRPLYVHDKY